MEARWLQRLMVISLNVKDFKVEDDKHWSFLIDDNINKAVEI